MHSLTGYSLQAFWCFGEVCFNIKSTPTAAALASQPSPFAKCLFVVEYSN